MPEPQRFARRSYLGLRIATAARPTTERGEALQNLMGKHAQAKNQDSDLILKRTQPRPVNLRAWLNRPAEIQRLQTPLQAQNQNNIPVPGFSAKDRAHRGSLKMEQSAATTISMTPPMPPPRRLRLDGMSI